MSELQSEERRLRESLDTATSRAQVLLLVIMITFLVSICIMYIIIFERLTLFACDVSYQPHNSITENNSAHNSITQYNSAGHNSEEKQCEFAGAEFVGDRPWGAEPEAGKAAC